MSVNVNECLNYCQLLNFSNIPFLAYVDLMPRSSSQLGDVVARLQSRTGTVKNTQPLCPPQLAPRPCPKAYETCECWTSSVFFSCFFFFLMTYSHHIPHISCGLFPTPPGLCGSQSLWGIRREDGATNLRTFENIWETDTPRLKSAKFETNHEQIMNSALMHCINAKIMIMNQIISKSWS